MSTVAKGRNRNFSPFWGTSFIAKLQSPKDWGYYKRFLCQINNSTLQHFKHKHDPWFWSWLIFLKDHIFKCGKITKSCSNLRCCKVINLDYISKINLREIKYSWDKKLMYCINYILHKKVELVSRKPCKTLSVLVSYNSWLH